MPRFAAWLRAPFQLSTRAQRRLQRKAAAARPRSLRLESLEDRRMLAYTVSFDSSSDQLTIAKAAADTANLSITESGENLNVADTAGTTFDSGTLTGAIGVTVTSSGVTINEADTNVTYVDYNIESGAGVGDTVTFGNLPEPIQGFGVSTQSSGSDTVIFTGNITTSSSLPIAGTAGNGTINVGGVPYIDIAAPNVVLAAAATAADTPGEVLLGELTYAQSAGNNLSINTSPIGTSAALAGSVTLGEFGNAVNHSYVNNLTVTAPSGSGAPTSWIMPESSTPEIITTDGTQTYVGAMDVGVFSPTCTLTSNNGQPIALGIVLGDASGSDLVVATRGTTEFEGEVDVSSVDVELGPSEVFGTSIYTTTTQNYAGAVMLADNGVFESSGAGADGDITFGSTIDASGDSSPHFSLDVETPGVATLDGALGGSAGSPDLSSIWMDCAATIAGGGVYTTGIQNYTGPVTITQSTSIASDDSSGQTITFSGTVDGTSALSLDINTPGTTTFSEAVGGQSSAPDLGSLDVENGPALIASGAVSTAATQNYNGAVTIGNPSTFSSTGSAADGDITFGSTVTGVAYALNVVTRGTTAVDGATNVASIDVVAGPTEIDGGTITTALTQNYAGAVTIGSNTTLTSTGTGAQGNITFGSTVDGSSSYSLQINTAGLTDFDGAVGGSASAPDLYNLSIQAGAAEIDGGAVSTAGVQTYSGAVTISADTTFTSTQGGLIFQSTLDGTGGLPNVVFSTNHLSDIGTQLDGAVGGSASAPDIGALQTLDNSTSSEPGFGVWATQISGGAISTAGPQNYGGPVAVLNDTTLTDTGTGVSGAITFASSVGNPLNANAYGLTINTAGLTRFEGVVGAPYSLGSDGETLNAGDVNPAGVITLGGGSNPLSLTSLASLDVGLGPTEIDSGVVEATQQTFAGAVTITQATTFGGGSTFDSTLDSSGGVFGVVVNGFATFDGAVGGSTVAPDISTLATSGAEVNNASITTTMGQTYGGVSVSGSVDFTSTTDEGTGIDIADGLGGYGDNYALASVTINSAVGTALDNLDGPGGLPTGPQIAIVNDLGALTVTGGLLTLVALTGAEDEQSGPWAVITTGPQTYNAPVQFTTAGGFVSTGTGAEGAITFASTVDGLPGGLSLSVDTAGLTDFQGVVGGAPNSPDVAELDVELGPTQIDGGAISTLGTQSYAGAVTFSEETTLKSTGTGAAGAITFGSTIDGIGDGLDTLHVVTSGLTTFAGAVGGSASTPDMEALDVQVGPAEIEGGSISTSSVQYYGNPVTITQDTTLTSRHGGWIRFNSTIDGSAGTESLVVDTPGLTTFSLPVGGSAGLPDLESLSVSSGPTEIDGGSISTLGTQNYAGALTISNETTLTSAGTGAAGAISFGSTIDGIGSGLDTLYSITAGLTSFGGAVGGPASTPDMEALDVQVGPATIEGGAISTRSVQYYGGAVAITQNTTFTIERDEYIEFNSTVDSSGGQFTLNSITPGLTTFNGTVGGSASSPDMEALNVQVGPATIAGGSISTLSGQDYGGAVTITQNTTLTSTARGSIEFDSTLDAGSRPAGLTITTSFPYTNDPGSPQLFNAAVGGQSALGYLVANVKGGIVLNSPIRSTGDMVLGGTAIMPAVLQINANLTSSLGSVGLTASQSVHTSYGDAISADAGTINVSAGAGSSGASMVSLYSTMQATGVFVTGNGGSNQLELPPLGQDSVVNESGVNSGTIGSYQGVNAAGAVTPFVQYTNEQNIAFEYAGIPSTSTLSIFTANNSSSSSLTTVIEPIASFNPSSTSAAANEANFYLEDNDITNVDVRVGRGNQTVNASETNANTLLEGDAYQEAGVSDTLMGGHAFNVLIGGQSQATLVAGDNEDVPYESMSTDTIRANVPPTVANYIFTHYEYTVSGGIGQWVATPTSIGGTPIQDTVNAPASIADPAATDEIVSNGADVINASGIMLTNGQATVTSSPSSNTTEAFTQGNVDAAEQAAIEAIFPQAASVSASGDFTSNSNPAGTQVIAAIPINYSPTPTSQSTDYTAPPIFYYPVEYESSGSRPLLISDPTEGDTIHVDFSNNGTVVTISADGFSQTWRTMWFSSIEIDANGNAVEISATAGNTTNGSINAQSQQAYASIQYLVTSQDGFPTGTQPTSSSSPIPSVNVSGAQTLSINNESGGASMATLRQLASSVNVVGQTELTDGPSSIALDNYGSGEVTINNSYARP